MIIRENMDYKVMFKYGFLSCTRYSSNLTRHLINADWWFWVKNRNLFPLIINVACRFGRFYFPLIKRRPQMFSAWIKEWIKRNNSINYTHAFFSMLLWILIAYNHMKRSSLSFMSTSKLRSAFLMTCFLQRRFTDVQIMISILNYLSSLERQLRNTIKQRAN